MGRGAKDELAQRRAEILLRDVHVSDTTRRLRTPAEDRRVPGVSGVVRAPRYERATAERLVSLSAENARARPGRRVVAAGHKDVAAMRTVAEPRHERVLGLRGNAMTVPNDEVTLPANAIVLNAASIDVDVAVDNLKAKATSLYE